MNTAIRVWERPSGDFARVILGEPLSCVRAGEAATQLFAPRALVAYLVGRQSRKRMLVFRTLEVVEAFSTRVPGVQQSVRLLLVAYTERRIYRARRLLRCIRRQGATPSDLSDAFYLRAATTLSSRVPIESIVAGLLRQEQCFDALGA